MVWLINTLSIFIGGIKDSPTVVFNLEKYHYSSPLMRFIKMKIRKCTWKRITDLIENPEGYLKICNLECDGFDNNCDYYTVNSKVKKDMDCGELEGNIEKYFFYPYYRSQN